jgi:hypothetical protein
MWERPPAAVRAYSETPKKQKGGVFCSRAPSLSGVIANQ